MKVLAALAGTPVPHPPFIAGEGDPSVMGTAFYLMEPVAGFNDHPLRPKWAALGTPDGEFLHSILVDPRDPRHLYIAISVGGPAHAVQYLSVGEAQRLAFPSASFTPLQPDRVWKGCCILAGGTETERSTLAAVTAPETWGGRG